MQMYTHALIPLLTLSLHSPHSPSPPLLTIPFNPPHYPSTPPTATLTTRHSPSGCSMPDATAVAALAAGSPTSPGSLPAPAAHRGHPPPSPSLLQAVRRPPVDRVRQYSHIPPLSRQQDQQVSTTPTSAPLSSSGAVCSPTSFSSSLPPSTASCAVVDTGGAFLGRGLTRKMRVLIQVELIFVSWEENGGRGYVLPAPALHMTYIIAPQVTCM